MTTTAPAAAPANTCPRCGLPVGWNASFNMQWDAQGGLVYRHLTCPTSAALANLPPITMEALDGLPYLTIAEAAHLLRISPSTIRARIRRRLLPAYRLRGGQTVLVRRQDVEGLLDRVHDPAAAPRPHVVILDDRTATQGQRTARLDAPDSDRTADGIGPDPALSEWPTALLTRRAPDAKGNYPGGMEALKAEEAELKRRTSAKP